VIDYPSASEELNLATAAVLEAGALVRAHFRAGGDVRFKSPDQPVTDADLLADELLRSRLLGARPAYGWLSEETADSTERLARSRVWVVDPIDGTNSFVAGIGEFVVSVGLVEDGIPIAAAVYNPVTEELYQALHGGGARRNGVPIRVAAPVPRGIKPVMLASRWELESGVLEPYGSAWELSALGSTAYRMLKVADGTAHAFVSPARKNEWDVCGAALVVTEAGGIVTRGDGEGLTFNHPVPELAGIVARVPSLEVLPSGR
jgi:myo-inositol-1(or 4)-monophosphatase